MDVNKLIEVLRDFYDYLAPLQTPYEQAIYMHFFRWSYLETGKQECRRGKRTIAKCALPAVWRGAIGPRGISYAHVDETLKSLQRKGHIAVGDTTRDGTLYVVRLPAEIEEVCRAKATTELAQDDLDYFNVPENRVKVFERDNWTCYYREDKVGKNNVTLDHRIPASRGGNNSMDNLVTCCLECNSIKSGKTPGEADVLLLKRYKEKLERRTRT